MAWINLIIDVQQADTEALSDALVELGALSVAIEDAGAGSAAEEPIFGEPGMAQDALWQRCRVTALLPSDVNPKDMVGRASALAGLAAAPDFVVQGVEDADWGAPHSGPVPADPHILPTVDRAHLARSP